MHVIRRLADKVAVMENGQVIEEGPVSEVFTHPKEELTKRFVSAEVDTKQTTDVKQVVTNLLEKNPQGKLVELKFHGQQVEQLKEALTLLEKLQVEAKVIEHG